MAVSVRPRVDLLHVVLAFLPSTKIASVAHGQVMQSFPRKIHEGESEVDAALPRPLAAPGDCVAGPDHRRWPSTDSNRSGRKPESSPRSSFQTACQGSKNSLTLSIHDFARGL